MSQGQGQSQSQSQSTINVPKINEEGARKIAAQMLVAKTLSKNPVQAVRLIMDNKHMFPKIDESKLIRAYNITSDQLAACESVKF